MHKETQKKVAAAILGVTLLGASFGLGGVLNPRIVPVEKQVVVEKIVEVPVPGPVQTVYEYVDKEVPVEVPVDNGNLQMVLQELVDKDGSVEYLTDGLDDDEVEMIVDRLFFTQEWESLAISKTKAKLFDELDKEEVGGIELDEDELRSLRIKDDEIEFEDIDFEDRDADVLVPFTLRQDDDRFSGVARVVILDGEVEDFLVEDIALE